MRTIKVSNITGIFVCLVLALMLMVSPHSSNINASTTLSTNTQLAAVGDIGCKDNSLATLENIAESGLPFIGLGDYMYKCHPGDDVGDGDRLGDLYAAIQNKVGGEGNHEAVSEQEEQWAEDTFKYPNDFAAWKLKDVGIIIMNPYVAFKKGSDQYNFVVAKTALFKANPLINYIVYATHEPLYTPAVTGGHSANTALRDLYAPIIKEAAAKKPVLLLEAHNHVTAFGKLNGINIAMCGSGGYGGDTLGKLVGFDWATSKAFGHCQFEFKPNAIVGQMIGTDGSVVKSQIFN